MVTLLMASVMSVYAASFYGYLQYANSKLYLSTAAKNANSNIATVSYTYTESVAIPVYFYIENENRMQASTTCSGQYGTVSYVGYTGMFLDQAFSAKLIGYTAAQSPDCYIGGSWNPNYK